MGFVAGIARRRYRYDIDHLSILRGPLVKIDHREEIRCNLSLILRPDIKNLVHSSTVIVLASPSVVVVLPSATVVLLIAMIVLLSALAGLGQRDGRCTER